MEKNVNLNEKEMNKSTLRLFKSYLGEKPETVEFNEEGLKYGLFIPNTASSDILEYAKELYGKDGEKWNQTFHKDFNTVATTPIEVLVAQQVMHYITTYGFESLGFYDEDLVYIPSEELNIPEIDVENENIEFITIKPITSVELQDRLMTLLTSGIALSRETIDDIMVLSDFIDKDRFDDVKNKEIKIFLYHKYDIMPRNPDEFLRYLIFRTTGETLKIQSREMIQKIRECDKKVALRLLKAYVDKTPNGYVRLSSIFLRNKNFFLAFKDKSGEYREINTIINKLRKLAVHNHKPLPKNVLDCLTDENITVDLEKLPEMLDNITIFREIRIINGILYRIYGVDSIVYKIRNGKAWVDSMNPRTIEYRGRCQGVMEVVYKHLVNRLREKVSGKTVYIPNNVVYVAPTSEKQFNGNIPEGSFIELPRDMDIVYGVHWENLERERVDLDLKQMNKTSVFGWDASYRSEHGDVLFSGDITNAPKPKGATELFYVSKNHGASAYLITLNEYTHHNKDVPFEFMIAGAKQRQGANRCGYVVDPNNILEKIDMVVKKDERQMVVGFIMINKNTIRFYFNDFSNGNTRTSSQNDVTMKTFEYLQSYNEVQLRLLPLLKDAGAILSEKETVTKEVSVDVPDEDGGVDTTVVKEVEVPVDYNLSLNAITKETLIDLLS